MRICLFSDWHVEVATSGRINEQLSLMQESAPDLIINLGDNCGAENGAKSTKQLTGKVRKVFPSTPFVSCLGNHDYWTKGEDARPSPEQFHNNYRSICETFKKHKVHFLDEDGVYRNPHFPGYAVAGHSLWYGHSSPPTNDGRWMPWGLDGDTHRYMQRKSYSQLFDSLETLTSEDTTRIFCSHFPVVNFRGADDELYSGPLSLGSSLEREFAFTKFLCGHAHQLHTGPLRYETGSDYGTPRHLILDF